jgi:hypothetical protein
MNPKKFLLVLQLLAMGLLVYSLIRWHQVVELTLSASPSKFQIIKTFCSSRRGSKVVIKYPKGEYYVEYPSFYDCQNLSPGDSLELYYSEELDLFSVPGHVTYNRHVYGLVAFLFWSVIPWKKMMKRLRKMKGS